MMSVSAFRISRRSAVLAALAGLWLLLPSPWAAAQSGTPDVQWYGIHLDELDFDKQHLRAYTDVAFRAQEDGLRQLALELRGLEVSEVLRGQEPLDFHRPRSDGDTLLIELSKPLRAGEQDTLRVHYEGHPVSPSHFGGFYFQQGYAYNLGVLIDGQPPSFGKAWFPCRDNFTDKAAFDVWIDAPAGMKAAGPGTLQGTEDLPDGTRYHWQLARPVPTYLVAVGVGDYATLEQELRKQDGTAIPARLFVRPRDSSQAVASFRHLQAGLEAFEERFGPYRWPRIGYVSVPMPGGAMEHATNIAYPHNAVDSSLKHEALWVHELSHSWFGNLVTCADPSQMWLNEGFARYSEKLFDEAIYGRARFRRTFNALHHKALTRAHRSDKEYHAIAPIPPGLTYSATVYDKGATAIHSLRHTLGDSLFFSSLRAYLDNFAWSNASTTDFHNFLEEHTGRQLDWFFEGWIRTPGWVHFAPTQLDASRREGLPRGAVQVDLRIEQQFIAREMPIRRQPLDVLFLDATGQRATRQLRTTGARTDTSLLLPFVPKQVVLDPQGKLGDASVREAIALAPAPDSSLTRPELRLGVRLDGHADSLRLYLGHHHHAPWQTNPSERYRLAPRHWSVNLASPSPVDARLRFRIGGWRNWAWPPEANITADTQPVLLHRAGPWQPWQKLSPKRPPTEGPRGEHDVARLWEVRLGAGEYVLAIPQDEAPRK